MKILTSAQLKKKLDKIFSEYIRKSSADKNGMVKCVTCGKLDHWKNVDCGHFSSRQYLATRYEEKNCHVQCRSCNRFHEGRKDDYSVFLVREYGANILDELTQKKWLPTFNFPYEKLIDEYKQKSKDLVNTPN